MNFKIVLAFQGSHLNLHSFQLCSPLNLQSWIFKMEKKTLSLAICHLRQKKKLSKTILPKVRHVASNKSSRQERLEPWAPNLSSVSVTPCSCVIFFLCAFFLLSPALSSTLPNYLTHFSYIGQGTQHKLKWILDKGSILLKRYSRISEEIWVSSSVHWSLEVSFQNAPWI